MSAASAMRSAAPLRSRRPWHVARGVARAVARASVFALTEGPGEGRALTQRHRVWRAARAQILIMLFAGALGGYYAYILGYNAELNEFKQQYLSSVSQARGFGV
jgi:hypothetical protein